MKKIIIFTLIIFTSIPCSAQLDGLIRDLKKGVEQRQGAKEKNSRNDELGQSKNEQLQPSISNAAELSQTEAKTQTRKRLEFGQQTYPIIDPDQLCQKLQTSKEIAEFAGLAKKMSTKFDTEYSFDTADELLTKWVASKNPENALKENNKKYERSKIFEIDSYLESISNAMDKCITKLSDSDLLYALSTSQRGYESLNKSIKDYNTLQAPKTTREIGPDGKAMEKVVTPKPPDDFRYKLKGVGAYYGSYLTRGSLSSGGTKAWLPVLLLAWDETGQVLTNNFPEIRSRYIKEIADREQEIESRRAQDQREQKSREQARAKELNEQKSVIKKFEDFSKSPDGTLTLAYQYFQQLQLCYEVRKGYAAVILTQPEFSEISNTIKMIESTIKPTLVEKNTEKLWASASSRNENSDPLEGSGIATGLRENKFESIKNSGRTNLQSAISTCNSARINFERIAETVIGKNKPQKKF